MFGDFEALEVLAVTAALLTLGYVFANRLFVPSGFRNYLVLSFLALVGHLLCTNLEQVFLPRIFNLLSHFAFVLSAVLLGLGAWSLEQGGEEREEGVG